MRSWNVVIERDAQTGLYVGYVPGWPGAHSQAFGGTHTLFRLASCDSMCPSRARGGEPRLMLTR
jgi:hypothetical protein